MSNKIEQLVQSYQKYISVPWREDAAAAQRVIFCVYQESDERRLRAGIDEFALVTRQTGHEWTLFDLTDSFGRWLLSQKYARSYFQKPQLLPTIMPRYLDYLMSDFENYMRTHEEMAHGVVSVLGVGSLFGLLKVSEVVDRFAPLVTGRLVVFFPGSCENNNYRLLDGYDGWNYLAVPITADKL